MSGLERLPRFLVEIAQVLEAVDDAHGRLGRALELTRELVPCARCALLYRRPDAEPELCARPEPGKAERAALRLRLAELMWTLEGDEAADHPSGRAAPRGRAHLAVPLIGLDRVIGVLFVERGAAEPYDDASLSLLTVAASQITTYLTMVRLLDAEARVRAELSRAHEFQQLLMGIVSHDLRNPLSVVVNGASLLRRRAADERQTKIAGQIIASAQRAARIIDGLLDVTRARLGAGIPIAPGEVDLAALARDVADEIRAAWPARRVELRGAESVVGEWDGDRLAQVLTNLLSNAAQHGADDAPIGLTLAADADQAVIEVHNHGPTIPEAILPHVFDPFRRGAVQARAAGQGLGLGLYIVHEIVSRHGGQVTARSTDAQGTTFTITLPRRAKRG